MCLRCILQLEIVRSTPGVFEVVWFLIFLRDFSFPGRLTGELKLYFGWCTGFASADRRSPYSNPRSNSPTFSRLCVHLLLFFVNIQASHVKSWFGHAGIAVD